MTSETTEKEREQFRKILMDAHKKVEEYMKTPEGQQELRDYLAKHKLTREDLDKEFTI